VAVIRKFPWLELGRNIFVIGTAFNYLNLWKPWLIGIKVFQYLKHANRACNERYGGTSVKQAGGG